MKKYISQLLFPNPNRQKILFGPSKGMYVKFDLNHRLQNLLGLYEKEIYYYLTRGIQKADVLIDIGANDGYFVLAFLKSGKKVIAYEPWQIADDMLKNAKLNGFQQSDKFIIERKLVGSEVSPDFISIKNVVVNLEGHLFFLVDIDGGEFDLLNSCGNEFDHASVSWLIETHTIELENACVKFLQKNNYNVTIIKNGWWRIFISDLRLRALTHNRWLYAEPKKTAKLS